VDAGEVVLKRPRGRPRKAYLLWKPHLSLDLERDRAIIEALERIPKGRRAAFVREALRAYIRMGGVESFLGQEKRYHKGG
jgi:hypothetical protein